jgi:hypothetical protein
MNVLPDASRFRVVRGTAKAYATVADCESGDARAKARNEPRRIRASLRAFAHLTKCWATRRCRPYAGASGVKVKATPLMQ